MLLSIDAALLTECTSLPVSAAGIPNCRYEKLTKEIRVSRITP